MRQMHQGDGVSKIAVIVPILVNRTERRRRREMIDAIKAPGTSQETTAVEMEPQTFPSCGAKFASGTLNVP